ncbi:hypothetical protein CKM354_000433800 [Cercospora kikuchii]|uniref:Mediator complex subunit 15 KIX domain-containing protein n=1 Tax=Cercospora kikuchii TaxID=84275 RepID=A0A9P3CE00_9PEZI|nr:uncharacterized protein CKM354_000433800 [Cercospora kikuchii]GIZ41021.1 hypothetical protein CKM354_000433800 [Cercospora kikuchii]
MEQPNMMAPNGMNQMGGAGGMQRPQNGNVQQQIFAKIMQELRNGDASKFIGAWQQAHSIQDRASRIMQLVSQLRLINADTSMCLAIAQKWESRTFEDSSNKEQYVERMDQKMREIRQRRDQQAGTLPLGAAGMMPNQMGGNNGMMRPGNMMGGMPNMPNMQNMQNVNAMNGMNGMNGMGFPNNAMGQQQNQMNGQNNPMFPAQLSRPMQPSPMPGQTGTLDPSALQMSSQGRQPSQQGQQPQQNNMNQSGQQQQAPNMGPGQPNQVLHPAVLARARQMFEKMPEEQKRTMRAQLLAQMSDAQRNICQQQKRDPVLTFCMKKAQELFDQRKQQMGAQQNPGMQQNGNNMNMQMNNNNNNNTQQRPPSQTGGQNFDVSGILGQQATAMKLQDAGEQVVPASNNNSNFNMGMGNQGINPQMLGNQGGQGGNNAVNPQQAAFFQQQQTAQQRERMQKQLMAQQQAMQAARMQQQQQQQQNQLTGQPGGLHAPNAFNGGAGGQAPSPAMSMLNRPMVPPGQATPGTPQPNRQQPMAPNANQLMQHHQNMLNQNQQQNQPGQQMIPQNLQDILSRVPPALRDKLVRMPPNDMAMMLAKMNIIKQPNGMGQPGQMNQPGMPGMPQQNAQQNANMMQQQMGNAMGGFNGQPPQNQPNMQMNPQAMMQRNAQQQQILRLRQQIMDQKPFPRQVLTALSISVPPQVQKWGDLKQHVVQNSSVVPQQTMERVGQLQQQWYSANAQEINSALQAFITQQRRSQEAQNGQQQPQVNNMPQQPSMGASQAPPAQMVPPAPMMQAPQAGGDPGQQGVPPQVQAQMMRMISPDEIARFRNMHAPKTQQMNDDMIRTIIVRQKISEMRNAQRAQQGQKPPGATPQIPRPQQANMPNGGQAQQRPPQAGPMQGQKPGSDDVVEVSNPALQQQAPQAPPMQASQSQQQGPTREQLAQMPPEQRAAFMQKRQAQLDALRKAQGGVGGAAPAPAMSQQEASLRLTNIMKEIQSTTPKGPPVNMDPQSQEKVKAALQRLYKPIFQMSTTFPMAMTWGLEAPLRDIIRAKLLLQQNVKDEQATMRDYYSLTQQQLQEMERAVSGYMNEFKQLQLRIQAQKGAAGKDQQSQAPPMAAAPSQQGHARKPSHARAPPAPTDDKKFDWSAQSPGVPMYAQDQPGLTQDKLKFPPQKKRKPNQPGSQVSTPAAQATTPANANASPALGSGKGQQSPEQIKKTQQQLKADMEREAESRRFKCKDSSCEHSLRGFDTEAQLNEHDKAQHQPVDDPLGFFLENATKALDVDKDGNANAKPNAQAAKAAPLAKPRLTAKDLKEDELTKQELEQVRRNIIPASVKQKLAKKQAELDAENEKAKEAEKEQTMREAMAQKLDLPLSIAEPVTDLPIIVDDNVFDVGLNDMDTELFESFGILGNQMTLESIEEMARENWQPVDGDLSSWRRVDEPGLTDSSPELTPDGSQNSDVSQSDTMRFMISVENEGNWDPWGNGQGMGVSETMLPMYMQIKEMMNNSNVSDEADVNMGGANEEGGEAQKSVGELSPRKRKAISDVWDVPVKDMLDEFFAMPQNGDNIQQQQQQTFSA